MDLEMAISLGLAESGRIIHVFSNDREIGSVIEECAEKLRFEVFRVAGSLVHNKDTLLTSISQAMRFPEYFGHNWDALEECLTDLQWIPSHGYIVLFEEPDLLAELSPRTLVTFLKIVISAAKEWANSHVPFNLVLVDGSTMRSFLEEHGFVGHYVTHYDTS